MAASSAGMTPCLVPLSAQAEAKRIRNADKRALFKPFRLQIVEDAYKRKLYSLFDDCCFACRTPGRLELDHHIPFRLGGRLVPGNIILLCPKCNNAKLDRHPSDFYPVGDLAKAALIFEQQKTLFNFRFDWDRLSTDALAYLLSLGVDQAIAEAYVAERREIEAQQIGVTIFVGLDSTDENKG